MAVWPSSLPAPLISNLSVELGSNAMMRKCQSGRKTAVRYGSGAPDRWQVVVRLRGTQFSAFRAFYNADLNLGANWFSADWITGALGYADHNGKIVGYPRETVSGKDGEGTSYKDISFELLIKPVAACPADTVWGE